MNSDNVVYLNNNHILTIEEDNELPLNVNTLLDCAKEEELLEVIVIGKRVDGEMYFAASSNNVAKVNYQLDLMKSMLIGSA